MLSATLIEPVRECHWVQEAVRLYQEPLTLYAVRMAGSVELGHDAVQETFVRLCEAEREDVEGHVKEWLFSVCRSRVLDLKRKEHRMVALAEPDRLTKSVPEPYAAAERNEFHSVLAGRLQALPPNQHEVIRLKFQHGLSYKEIAAITGLSVSNVGFLMHTGIATLRKHLRKAI